MKKLLFLLFILPVLILSACKITIYTDIQTPSHFPTPTDKPDIAIATLPLMPSGDFFAPEPSQTEEAVTLLGKVSGNLYVNEALGFSATIPEGWEAADEQAMSDLSGFSADYLKKATGLEANSQMYIFYCSKHGAYYSGLNANINIAVSNQPIIMLLLNSEDGLNTFLEQYRPLVEKLYDTDSIDVSGESGVKVGTREYVTIHIRGNINGTNIAQDQYFIGVKNYVIVLTFTYFDDTEKAVCDSFLERIKYDQ